MMYAPLRLMIHLLDIYAYRKKIKRKGNGHFALKTLDFSQIVALHCLLFLWVYSLATGPREKFMFPSRSFFKIDARDGGAEPILVMGRLATAEECWGSTTALGCVRG